MKILRTLEKKLELNYIEFNYTQLNKLISPNCIVNNLDISLNKTDCQYPILHLIPVGHYRVKYREIYISSCEFHKIFK